MKTPNLLTVLALMAPAGALAAEPPRAAPTELGKLVVSDTEEDPYTAGTSSTATKTDTPLIETPASVQVVTQQQLHDQQATTLDQALLNVSGVRSSNVGWSENIYLRGFVTETVFRDGFRIDDPSNLNGLQTLSNVDSIEVLKGPASILYGRVEPGGVINIITKQPKPDAHYAFEQTAGSWGEYTTTLDATGPLNSGKTLLYSLNASHHQNDLFIDNVHDRRDFIAPSLRWVPDAATQITLEASYSRNRSTLYQQSLLPYDIVNHQYVFGPRNANPWASEFDPDTTFVGLNWSHAFGKDWTLRQHTSYNRVDLSTPVGWSQAWGAMYNDAGTWTVQMNSSQLTARTRSLGTILDLEGHFRTGLAEHTVLIGGDYYDTTARYDSHYSNPGGPFQTVPVFSSTVPPVSSVPIDPLTYYRSDTTSKSWGLYVQDQVKLTRSVQVLAGLRYQHAGVTGTTTTGENYYGGSGLPTPNVPANDHGVTPRAAMLWLPQPNLSVYASYTENFGATNAATADWQGRPLKPEGAKQYEVGAKQESKDGRLSGSIALFDLTKNNLVAADVLHPDGFGGYFQTNIGKINSRGVELTLQGEVAQGWEALLAYTYDWAVVTEGTSVYATGTRTPHVPANMLRLYSTYEARGDALRGLKIGGGLSWQGAAPGMYVDPDTFVTDSHTIVTPGHVVFDAMASYRREVGPWKVTTQLNVRNLFDRRYYTDAFMYFAPWGYVTYGAPRSFLLSVRVER